MFHVGNFCVGFVMIVDDVLFKTGIIEIEYNIGFQRGVEDFS